MKLSAFFVFFSCSISFAAIADYQTGRDCLRSGDSSCALVEFQKAAAEGNSDALFGLVAMYREGKGVQKDETKAFELIHQAAASGHANAQMKLSRWYEDGEIVSKDDAKALEWLQKAAAQGQPAALEFLGLRYIHGRGVKKDYTKAIELFQKAAYQGYWAAQASLGQWYEYGQYVTRDYAKAIEWSQKAAVQGDRDSKNRVLRLNHILECEKSAKTKLFGVLIKCANRDHLKAAVINAGGKEKLENKTHRSDVYDSVMLLKGSSELEIYTHYGKFVAAQYTFPSHLDPQQILRVHEFVSNKYGNPTTSSGNTALGNASFEWNLDDDIILQVSRGWPDTTTYLKFINPENYQLMQAEQERERKELETKEYRKQSNSF